MFLSVILAKVRYGYLIDSNLIKKEQHVPTFLRLTIGGFVLSVAVSYYMISKVNAYLDRKYTPIVRVSF